MKKVLFAPIIAFLLISCGEESETLRGTEITVSFRSSEQNIRETDRDVIFLTFSEPADFSGTLEISVLEFNAIYGEDFTTQPAAVDGIIVLSVNEGAGQTSFIMNPRLDTDSFVDSLEFSLSGGSSPLFKIGSPASTRIFITEVGSGGTDTGNITGDGTCSGSSFLTGTVGCSPIQQDAALEVATWNIEFFPKENSTVSDVIEIIRALDADVIVFQEINSVNDFNTVVNSLAEYDGFVVDVRGDLEHAFVYKTTEITSISTPKLLFSGQTSPFPREPVEIDVTHVNGLTVKLINLHLKCCSGSESRRLDASNKLKEYVDINFPDDEVIILGDWNEDFDSGSSFTNFLNDTDNYIFADLPIYQGSGNDYSYPCTGASFCPSHIDHILVSNELCDNLSEAYTVRLDDCVSGYLNNVSDHRPVMVRLQADE